MGAWLLGECPTIQAFPSSLSSVISLKLNLEAIHVA